MYYLKNNNKYELIKEKSKFIALSYFIEDENIFLSHKNELEKIYNDATHITYAYKINNVERFSDDNEPGGSAGRQILNAINSNNLDNIVIFVVRYFGGIKLGLGPLSRTYLECANNLINQALKYKLDLYNSYDIIFDYVNENMIANYINKNNGIIKNKQYTNDIVYSILINDIKDIVYLLKEYKCNGEVREYSLIK